MNKDPRAIRATLVAKNLKTLRTALGLTQRQLADASGVERTTIIALEQGARLNPQIGTLEPLALALGTTAGALLAPSGGSAQ